jgi:hypothetical protein
MLLTLDNKSNLNIIIAADVSLNLLKIARFKKNQSECRMPASIKSADTHSRRRLLNKTRVILIQLKKSLLIVCR